MLTYSQLISLIFLCFPISIFSMEKETTQSSIDQTWQTTEKELEKLLQPDTQQTTLKIIETGMQQLTKMVADFTTSTNEKLTQIEKKQENLATEIDVLKKSISTVAKKSEKIYVKLDRTKELILRKSKHLGNIIHTTAHSAQPESQIQKK